MKKTSIDNALAQSIAQVTSIESLMKRALAKEASRQDLKLSDFEIECLTEALLNVEDNKVNLELEAPCGLGKTQIEIENTLQQLVDGLNNSFNDIVNDVTKAISAAVPEAIAAAADVISEQMVQDELAFKSHLKNEHDARVAKVQDIWGGALEQMDILRNVAFEWNFEALKLRKGSYANTNTASAINAIMGRVYEVAGEIIVLAKSGYADGALARWRTLHEICVIAIFLSKRSDRCAYMYLAHHQIEELKLLQANRITGTAFIGIKDERYLSHLRRKRFALIREFGPAFGNDYGWASIELSRTRTTLRDLENEVGLDILRRGYQKASSTVHGGAFATLTRISAGGSGADRSTIPAAYGCELAVKYATGSLSMMCAELCLEIDNADLVTMGMIVQKYASRVREEITEAEKKMLDESRRSQFLQRKVSKKNRRIALGKYSRKP
jgi:hypothetical protein